MLRRNFFQSFLLFLFPEFKDTRCIQKVIKQLLVLMHNRERYIEEFYGFDSARSFLLARDHEYRTWDYLLKIATNQE